MQINMKTYSLYTWRMIENKNLHISRILGTPTKENNEGMKYLGFTLNGKQLQQKGLAMVMWKS